MKKQVVAYLRVSTDNQVGEDKYGLDVQRKDIEQYCLKNNLEIVKWYVEEGVSGGKLDRPQLNLLLNGDIANPPIDSVVVAKSDRLSRDIQLYYFIKLSLKKKNIELLSVQEDWEAYGTMAPMIEALVVAFAEFERQMITSRTANGRKAKAKTGGYSGGKPPYGYIVKDGNLIVDPVESEVVKGIFSMKEDKLSLRYIANQLNDMGITTKSGAKWYAAQVGYITNNEPVYRGYYKYSDDEWVEGQHEAIL